MPSYDYKCEACGYTFEEFQAMSDPVLTECPECKKQSLKRLIGGGLGIIFKGSGFYVNDTRKSSGSSPSSSSNSSAHSKTSSLSSDSSASKPSEPASSKASDSGSKDSSASAAAS